MAVARRNSHLLLGNAIAPGSTSGTGVLNYNVFPADRHNNIFLLYDNFNTVAAATSQAGKFGFHIPSFSVRSEISLSQKSNSSSSNPPSSQFLASMAARHLVSSGFFSVSPPASLYTELIHSLERSIHITSSIVLILPLLSKPKQS